MPHPADRATVTAALLAHVHAAAGDTPPAIIRDYTIGSSGAVADLAVAAEEFIGFAVHVAGEPLAALAERLAIAARYFDRVVVVTAEAAATSLQAVDLSGAALWTIDPAGMLVEQQAGRPNVVSPAALFDLMTPDQRARLLRPAVRIGRAYDRARPPIPAEAVSEHLRRHLGQASAGHSNTAA